MRSRVLLFILLPFRAVLRLQCFVPSKHQVHFRDMVLCKKSIDLVHLFRLYQGIEMLCRQSVHNRDVVAIWIPLLTKINIFFECIICLKKILFPAFNVIPLKSPLSPHVTILETIRLDLILHYKIAYKFSPFVLIIS